MINKVKQLLLFSSAILIINICLFAFLPEAAAAMTENTTAGSQEATKPVTQPSADSPTAVYLNKASDRIGVGEKIKLTAKVNDGAVCDSFMFSSSNENVLTVSSDGTVTALSKGTATVTVRAGEKASACCRITVRPAPQWIKLSKSSLTLGVGESFDFNYSLPKGTASGKNRYSTDNSNVLQYTKSGVFKALKTGTATETVTTFNGKTSSCKVTVMSAPSRVTLNKTKLTLGIGESFDFNSSVPSGSASYKRSFSSSNPSVLKYTKFGIFKALKKGTVTVTVRTYNGKTAACKVTVLPAAQKITLNKTNLTLGVGESFDFNYSIPKGTASNKNRYSTNNSKVLQYTKSGIFKALKKGTATVTVTTFNGKSATCKVTVLPQPEKIYPAADVYTVNIGSTKKAVIKFPEGTYCSSFTFTSADKSIAYCDSKGKIHAKKMGTTEITARSLKGKTCKFTVKVRSMDVPFVSQKPKYPTGCEAASCASLLKYYGYNITLEQMVDIIPRQNITVKNGKRWGPDINKSFVGDPRGGYTSKNPGYGAFSPCVTKSLQKAIDERRGSHTATRISGCSFSTLLGHISDGKPAIVWATYKMQVPKTVNSWYINETGKYFEYPRGTHVMVLIGYSDSTVSIMDPYDGPCTFDISTFEKRWNLLGKQAIILK